VRGWHQKDEAPRPLPPKRPLKAKENVLRFVPLGGMEEIGRNCSFFEYNDEIVVIDVGIQFPEEFTPGIDYIIPDATYLESVKHKVKGIVLTHGHYDHIAAIHYLLEKLGNPIVYTSRFTGAMVQKRHEEFTNAPKMKLQTVQPGDRVRLSEHLTIEFFAVEHTVPEAYGFILETPAGNMASFGDFRLDIGKDGKPQNMQAFEMLRSRNIHTLLMDSTNADSPGHGSSEDTVIENLEILVRNAKGRIIIACFASLVDRILEIIDIAEKLGRKVALNGRSMKGNLDIAKSLGYLKEKKDVMIPLEDISKYPDSKLLILTTGSQGESNAGLMRIVNGEHRVVRLKENDTVVFSSSVIPGNERSIQTLQDNISRQVDELYNSKLLDIHASGHAHGADVELVISVVKPKFVVPIHGYYFKRKSYIKHAIAAGLKRSQVILMDNGQIAELTPDTFTVTKDSVPSTRIMVDGLGIGDVEEVVLRDRMNLSQEGMIVVILTMDRNHSKMLRNPDIISRGFIHLKDNNMVLDEIRKRVTGLIARLPQDRETESDYIKSLVRDQVGQFVYNKTKRRPMVLPVVIEL
jgi:beta-CASP RNase J family ribonuclease